MSSSPRQKRPSFAWLLLALLTLVGVGLSLQLTYLHVQVHTNPGYQSFCAVSEKVNCEAVAQSPFSVLGGLPVSVWGLLGYLLILLVAFLGWKAPKEQRQIAHGALLLLTSVSLLMSAIFATISFVFIESLCLLCLATYVLNPFLLLLAFLSLRPSAISATEAFRSYLTWQFQHTSSAFLPAFVITALWLGYPRYWQAFQETSADQALATGFDGSGHPWIGAKKPRLTLTVFSDYQCPFCRRANVLLREKLRSHPSLRVTHQHYPLDHQCNPTIRRPFHQKACLFARAAFCAGLQGRFWKMNDFLYEKARDLDATNLPLFAKRLGMKAPLFQACLTGKISEDAVAKDLHEGRRRKVQGTPVFFLAGSHDDLPSSLVQERGSFGSPRPLQTLQAFVDYADKDSRAALDEALTLLRPYKDRVRLLLRSFPQGLSCNPASKSPKGRASCFFAKASFCAAKQQAFPAIHNLFSEIAPLLDEKSFFEWSFFLNLSSPRLASCFQDPQTPEAIQSDLKDAQKAGLDTPGFLFQGRPFPGRLPKTLLPSLFPPPASAPASLPASLPSSAPAR